MMYVANFEMKLSGEDEKFMRRFLKSGAIYRLQEVINNSLKTLEDEWKDEKETINLKCDKINLITN